MLYCAAYKPARIYTVDTSPKPVDKKQYFYRTVVFTRKNDEVALANIHNSSEITPLEPWLGVVLSLADGQHTVDELFEYMRSHYQGMIPEKFENTLESVLERLFDSGFIKYGDEKITLPYYLADPIEDLDTDRAVELMQEHGYSPEQH